MLLTSFHDELVAVQHSNRVRRFLELENSGLREESERGGEEGGGHAGAPLGFAQHQVYRPAAAEVMRSVPQVVEQLAVGAAVVFEGVGQDG